MQPQIPRNCSKNTDNIMPKTAHFTIFFKCKISPQIFCGKNFTHDFPLPRKCESCAMSNHNNQTNNHNNNNNQTKQ